MRLRFWIKDFAEIGLASTSRFRSSLFQWWCFAPSTISCMSAFMLNTSCFRSPWRIVPNRTRQPLDSAKVRFQGGAGALTDILADHVREQGVNVVLECVVDRVSTADADAVVVQGVHVRSHPRGTSLSPFFSVFAKTDGGL